MINNDQASVAQRSYEMPVVRRNNRNNARPSDLALAIDRQLKFTLEYFIDFLLRMEVLVDRGSLQELVMCERHVVRMKVTAFPAR